MHKRLTVTFALLLGMFGLLAACGGSTPPAAEADEPAIYAAAIRQLYTVDHTFGEPPNWPTVYVVSTTDDTVGTMEGQPTDLQTLSTEAQQAITAALSDLPAQIVWIGDRTEAPVSDENGLVENGDAIIITLGNQHPQTDGSVQLPASLYCGMLCATGMTYVVEQVDGVWQVTGTTGLLWMS